MGKGGGGIVGLDGCVGIVGECEKLWGEVGWGWIEGGDCGGVGGGGWVNGECKKEWLKWGQ